jgi:hypothetical protein
MGKGTRLPSPPAKDIRATKPAELIHIDLWGPAAVTFIGGARYFLTCYDDYSRKVHLSFLKQRSDGQFTSKEWDNYMRQIGIQHIRVPPAAHVQNGRVKHVRLTILNLVRTYLINTGLPQSFWAECASYAAYLL